MYVHDASVKLLLNKGADVQAVNKYGNTLMHCAAMNGHLSTVKLLGELGLPFETKNNAVAEPVVYMLGRHVIGGFYRIHESRGKNENLNAPGAYFEPLAFETACNNPMHDKSCDEEANRFYMYGVISRLASLAAAREIIKCQPE